MTATVVTDRLELPSLSGAATLKAAARFWFVVAVLGQLLFAFTVASYYGLTAARGDLGAWNRHMTHGYAAGERTISSWPCIFSRPSSSSSPVRFSLSRRSAIAFRAFIGGTAVYIC